MKKIYDIPLILVNFKDVNNFNFLNEKVKQKAGNFY